MVSWSPFILSLFSAELEKMKSVVWHLFITLHIPLGKENHLTHWRINCKRSNARFRLLSPYPKKSSNKETRQRSQNWVGRPRLNTDAINFTKIRSKSPKRLVSNPKWTVRRHFKFLEKNQKSYYLLATNTTMRRSQPYGASVKMSDGIKRSAPQKKVFNEILTLSLALCKWKTTTRLKTCNQKIIWK
jgi:hypothetical protein